jgi:hypothetical protein
MLIEAGHPISQSYLATLDSPLAAASFGAFLCKINAPGGFSRHLQKGKFASMLSLAGSALFGLADPSAIPYFWNAVAAGLTELRRPNSKQVWTS